MQIRILTAGIIIVLAGVTVRSVSSPVDPTTPTVGAATHDLVPMGPLPRDVVPLRYRLAFTIDPSKPRFTGHDEIDVRFADARRALYLDGKDLDVRHALVRLPSGETIAARFAPVHDSGIALLSMARDVPAGNATLVFDYDANFGNSLAGLYKVVDAGNSYAFTQFEAADARRAFPAFDEPGFKTPFEISVTAPAGNKVIANTPVLSETAIDNGPVRTLFEPTVPLPTYLIALAVGPLDIVDGGDVPANSWRPLPLHVRGITAKGKGEQIRFALSFTPRVVAALEDYFGIAYPFRKLDIIAVPDFAAGAMENAGAITFRERLVLMDGRAPLEQQRRGLVVQAHEITHQWFGDLVTPHWWDDTWLNESFANWMEFKIAGAIRSDWEFHRETLRAGLAVMNLDELASARAIHQPVNDPGDIENSFDAITYNKGAAVLSMFESYVGEAAFRAGVSAYLRKFAGGNATARDFIGTVAEATRHPEIVGAFEDFIDRPGIPDLETTRRCSVSGNAMEVSQSMYAPIGRTPVSRIWHVPMCVSIPGRSNLCKLIDAPSTTLPLDRTCPAYLFPNAQGSGYYRFNTSEAEWRMLIAAAPQLDAAEQLTLFSNISAALAAGKASAADYLSIAAASAPNAKWDLTAAIHDSLHDMDQRILRLGDRPSLQSFVRKRFAPRLQALSYRGARLQEPAGLALLRPQLAALMVEEARDPQVISALIPAAGAYLASDGLDAGGMSRDLMQEAMRAGVLGGGASFEDALVAAFLKSGKEYFRQLALIAAGATESSSYADRWLALAPQMRSGEVITLLRSSSNDAVMRGRIWVWLKANYDVLNARLPPGAMAAMPGVMARACDQASRADLDSFFRPKLARLPGAVRPLALAEEQIDRCIAFKAAKGAEIAAALKAAR